MPHHPRTGREVEEAIAGMDVAVDYMLLFVLDERPEGGMDYTFWFSCCAGGIEDVDWVARWEGRENHFFGLVTEGRLTGQVQSLNMSNCMKAQQFNSGGKIKVALTDASSRNHHI